MKLLIATTNLGKIREIEEILNFATAGSVDLEIIGFDEVKNISPPEETGATYEENALIKARHYYSESGVPSVADDSGLEVDALGGRPGVFSARYAGSQATDGDRIAKLLEELRSVPASQRTARFACAAAFVGPMGEKVFNGYASGSILESPSGVAGFGYDPVFWYGPLQKTFAEMPQSEKSRISHRGIAFAKMGRWLADLARKQAI